MHQMGFSSINNTFFGKRTHAVMFGKPLCGRPIPAEQIRVHAMMSNRGCGSARPLPIRSAIGTSSTAAMVWEMLWGDAVISLSPRNHIPQLTHNVATTKLIAAKMIRTV